MNTESDADNTKRCPRCESVKALAEFHRSSKSRDGRQGYCKQCVREDGCERAARKPSTRKARIRRTAPDGRKHCTDCDQFKPLADFPRNRRTADGYAQYCKPCHNARGKESKQRLHGGTRHYHLMRRYGIGAADVAAMVEAQGGLCAVCREATVQWHVDHDHATGKIRAVLCSSCNQGLGNFRDRPEVMAAAIEYLEAHDPAMDELRAIASERLSRIFAASA